MARRVGIYMMRDGMTEPHIFATCTEKQVEGRMSEFGLVLTTAGLRVVVTRGPGGSVVWSSGAEERPTVYMWPEY